MSEKSDPWTFTDGDEDWHFGDLVFAEVGGQTYLGIILTLRPTWGVVFLANGLEAPVLKSAMTRVRLHPGSASISNFAGVLKWRDELDYGDPGSPPGFPSSAPAPSG